MQILLNLEYPLFITKMKNSTYCLLHMNKMKVFQILFSKFEKKTYLSYYVLIFTNIIIGKCLFEVLLLVEGHWYL